MIIAKIDVMKIDKSKLFPGKNGAKYCDLVHMENRDGPDRYGNDGFVVQGVSKEDREKKIRGNILGNWKRIGAKDGSAVLVTPASRPASRPAAQPDETDWAP